MIKSGLVSVSFSNMPVEKVLQMCEKAQLDCIEWSGRKHIEHGDVVLAEKLAKMTADAGIEIASYGSYYIAALSEVPGNKNALFDTSFQAVLDSALALKTKSIRVWAGNGIRSMDISKDGRKAIVDDLLRIGAMAAPYNIKISLEFHNGTLTDSNESAILLKDELGSDSNIDFYWQPPIEYNDEQCMTGIRNLSPNISNVHVFHGILDENKYTRLLLESGATRWISFLHEIADDGNDHAAMLEFIADNSEENFYKDALTLKQIINEV